MGGSLTPKVYLEINEAFIKRYGEKAGWAHQILFAADLDSFAHKLANENSKKRKADQITKTDEGGQSEEEGPKQVPAKRRKK